MAHSCVDAVAGTAAQHQVGDGWRNYFRLATADRQSGSVCSGGANVTTPIDHRQLTTTSIGELGAFSSVAASTRNRLPSQKPDSPDALCGLSKAAIRVRDQQRQERILKTQTALEQHQAACSKWHDRPAF